MTQSLVGIYSLHLLQKNVSENSDVEISNNPKQKQLGMPSILTN